MCDEMQVPVRQMSPRLGAMRQVVLACWVAATAAVSVSRHAKHDAPLLPQYRKRAPKLPEETALDSMAARKHSKKNVTKVVFMHTEHTGGSSITEWLGFYHAACASGKDLIANESAGEHFTELSYGDTRNIAHYDDASSNDPTISGGEDDNTTVSEQACGTATKVCSLGQKFGWKKDDCADHIQSLVDMGCTFVELKDYDMGVVNAFKSHGFAAVTLLREPMGRLKSKIARTAKKRDDGKTACCFNEDEWQEQLKKGTIGSPDIPLQHLSGCYSAKDDAYSSCFKDETLRGNDPDPYGTVMSDLAERANNTYCFAEDHMSEGINVTGANFAGQGSYAQAEKMKMHAEKWANIAINNLDKFDLVVTLEHIDTVWPALAAMYGLTDYQVPPVKIAPPDTSEVDDLYFQIEDDELISSNLLQDLRVWCHAVKMHQKAVRSLQLPSFDVPQACYLPSTEFWWQEPKEGQADHGPDYSRKFDDEQKDDAKRVMGTYVEPPLAPGWTEAQDPRYDNRTYWYTESGETTWERPEAKEEGPTEAATTPAAPATTAEIPGAPAAKAEIPVATPVDAAPALARANAAPINAPAAEVDPLVDPTAAAAPIPAADAAAAAPMAAVDPLAAAPVGALAPAAAAAPVSAAVPADAAAPVSAAVPADAAAPVAAAVPAEAAAPVAAAVPADAAAPVGVPAIPGSAINAPAPAIATPVVATPAVATPAVATPVSADAPAAAAGQADPWAPTNPLDAPADPAQVPALAPAAPVDARSMTSTLASPNKAPTGATTPLPIATPITGARK